LNDTSVAVVALNKGDKRLFFQESSGSIREALYTSSTGQWTADTNNIVAADAKNSTPLAAFGVNNTGTLGTLGTQVDYRVLLLQYSANSRLLDISFLCHQRQSISKSTISFRYLGHQRQLLAFSIRKSILSCVDGLEGARSKQQGE